ncbi:MAG: hypothetical protein JST89_19650 [Cyanobacteria bacterium SZAS-4]|nr:hypothetical protein [Cyanobacteria bacterium SZAS-4]
MGEAHKIGDSFKSPGAADVNPGGPIDINVVEMWKMDSVKQRAMFSATALDRTEGGKIEAAASKFATEISQGKYTDSEVAKRFTGAVQEFSGSDAFHVAVAFNGALKEKGAPWHVEGKQAGNEGTVRLWPNTPEYDRKVLVKSEFFKPGEDMDANFSPDKAALSKIASDFARRNPDHLSPDALATEVSRTIGAMKAAGAGPQDADDALNKALKDSGQGLAVSINTRGRIKSWPHHENRAVAEVDLTKL